MSELVEKHRASMQCALKQMHGHSDWSSRPVRVIHKPGDIGTPYHATILHPPTFDVDQAIKGVMQKRYNPYEGNRHDGTARVVYIAPYGHSGATAVQVQLDGKGNHSICGGVGNRLNGLLVQGLLSDDAYEAHKHAQIAQVMQGGGSLAQIKSSHVNHVADSSKPVVVLQRHPVPMTRLQARQYVNILNSDRDREEKDALLRSAINDHQAGGKHWAIGGIIRKFPVNDKVVIVAHHYGAGHRIANHLKQMGYSVARDDGGNDGVMDAGRWSGAVRSDGAMPRILVTPHERISAKSAMPHHVIYYDTEPSGEFNPAIHISAHATDADVLQEGRLRHKEKPS